MARLRVIEDDQSALSANPWEEELRKREEEVEEDEDEEQEQQIQASQPSIPGTPTMPKTQTQKGLALIFVKVDHQIELLDKQLNNVQAELLQARDLVMAVRRKVTNLNKPDASELLEVDVFTNYLRIGDRLKTIANNINMIVPDHGRQVIRAQKTYDKGFMYSDSDPGEPDPEPSIKDSMACEPDESSFREEPKFSESAFGEGSFYEPSVREFSAYASDEFIPPPSGRRQQTMRWYSEGPRYIRLPPRIIYNRRREPISRNRRMVHYASTSSSNSSTASGNFIYDNLTDSSNLEDWPRSPYRVRKRSLPSGRYPYHYTRRRDLREASAATRRRGRPSFSRPEANVTEFRESLVREESRILSEEPGVVVEPKGAQALSLEAILHEEQNFLLEKLYEVQDRLRATQSRQAVKSPTGDKVEGSNLKGNLWTRLKSKFIDHSKKQDEHDIAK